MSEADSDEGRSPAVGSTKTPAEAVAAPAASEREIAPAVVGEGKEDTMKTSRSIGGVDDAAVAPDSRGGGDGGAGGRDQLAAASAGAAPAADQVALVPVAAARMTPITDCWPRGRDILLADVAAAAAAAAAGAAEGGLDAEEAVKAVLEKHPLSLDQAMKAVTPHEGNGEGEGAGRRTAFFTNIAHNGSAYVARAWAEVYSTVLPPVKTSEACTVGFSTCCAEDPRRFLPGMSVLFAYGAEVDPKDLIDLARVLTLKDLKECFLGGLAFVDNPFIPGVSLSVAIEESLKNATDRERPNLTALQETLDDLILEVLDRMPKTIAEFPGRVSGCEVVFEPEIAAVIRDRQFRGPLRLALQERQFSETLCISPLVFEYMSHRFVAGLPNIQDTNDLLRRRRRRKKQTGASQEREQEMPPPPATATTTTTAGMGEGRGSSAAVTVSTGGRKGRDFLYDNGFVASHAPGKLLQGLGWTESGQEATSDRPREWERIFSGTVLPGAQFVLIGVLTRPASYYKVPAMRMLLGFYVHIIMLVLYTAVVLEDDDGELSGSEMFLTFYVAAEIVSNLVQMWANFLEYVQDKWNWLECLSLSLLAGGLFVRVVDSDVHVGRALFALSAPLVFSRILFFGQILRRQGLVIQMMAILFGEMIQFGLVLGTIMMGFTVSFFALFQEEHAYGEVWLDVFKAMLGEVGVFQDLYDGNVYRNVAKVLLVVYLLVVAVMLLNLLIAVLSTEHAKVEQQQDRAFRESKVRIIKLFGRMVDGDILPSPFNLVQLVLWLLLTGVDRLFDVQTCRQAIRKFGVGTFWLMLGPPTILTAWGLWAVSLPTAVLTVWRRANFTGMSLTFAVIGSSAVAALHVLLLQYVAMAFWAQSGLALLVSSMRELAVSLVGGGGNRSSEADDHPRRRSRLGAADSLGSLSDGGGGTGGVGDAVDAAKMFGDDAGSGGAPSSSAAAASSFAAAASVANMLKEAAAEGAGGGSGVGGGATVAEIWAYLENPSTTAGLARRHDERAQAATREHVIGVRHHLDAAGKERGEKVLTALAAVDANVRAIAAEVVAEKGGGVASASASASASAGSVEGFTRDSSSSSSLLELIEEKVAEVVERSVAPLRESLATLLREDPRFEMPPPAAS